jgi:hypothetical protein
MALSDGHFGLSNPDFLKLKSEFERILKTCPTTEVRETAGISASTVRNLLKANGWAHIIKTNDQVAELAQTSGLDVSVHEYGSRSGTGELLIIRDKDGRSLGGTTWKDEDTLTRKAHKLFGFPVGTKKNAAAAMYLSAQGATTEEVIQKVGDTKLNLLKEVEARGYSVMKSKVRSARGTTVTSRPYARGCMI